MKAVIQRVKEAEVIVNGKSISVIGTGIVTLLAICQGDGEENLRKMIEKICNLRLFSDEKSKMNRSLIDIQGQHLIVSQFTLAADCTAGRRPSFTNAADPEIAKDLYQKGIALSEGLGIKTLGGEFQANMNVHLINDGPVTFSLEF